MLAPALLLACQAHLPRDLGDHPADGALLADTPELAHLADALRHPDGVTVETLFREGDLNYRYAPDPSALFDAERAAHAALPALGDSVEISVLTYNVGLLSRTYVGSLVEVPEIATRREAMAEALFTAGYDVLLLQETWEWADYQALEAAAPEYGYVTWGGSQRLHEQHGLTIAVRAELIDENAAQEQTEQQFHAQRKLEHWPGPNVRRGWITWSFQLAGTSTRIHLYDLHATSFVGFWRLRDMQAREVGLEIAARPADDVVLLGGDLNSGPYYRADVWLTGEGLPEPGWWRNASAYALWLHYGELFDLLNAAEVPADVRLGKRIPVVEAETLVTEPFGQAEWCEEIAGQVFTGSDCNSLYYRQYGGTEYPARLDHLMARDPSGKLRVTGSELAFEAPLDGAGHELSDHYGLGATVEIASE